MSKQTTDGPQDTKNQQKIKPEVRSEPLAEHAGVVDMAGGLIGAPREASFSAQVAQLGDSRFQLAQRVALAAEIGRIQGNLHLQRVVADVQRCAQCGDPSHVPEEEEGEGVNNFAPLPDSFYDDMNVVGRRAQAVHTTARDLLIWVQGRARLPLEEAIERIERADGDLEEAVEAAQTSAEQRTDERASPAAEQDAYAALLNLLDQTDMAQDIIEPVQDLAEAGLRLVFAAINRGLGEMAQQLMADIRAAQAEITRLRQRSQAAERELGQAFGQLGLNLALAAVGLALTAMMPPVGIAFSVAAAGGSMIWDRMLGPQGSDVPGAQQGSVNPSDVNASTSIGLTLGSAGLERFGLAGTRLARATNALGPVTIAVGTYIDAQETRQAIANYESLPGQIRAQQAVLEGLLRRYRALGPFMRDYQNAERRAQALEATAARLRR